MTSNEIKDKLSSSKSADRRRAAKEIGKSGLSDLGAELYLAYLKEKQDKRTWETQTEMIRSLGLINSRGALPDIKEIVTINLPHNAITGAAATTYVQLSRDNPNDASQVIELLKTGGISVVTGALTTLAVDEMIPADDEIKEIISLSWDINKHPDRIGEEFGLIDPRVYLALACYKWKASLTHDFLIHCLNTAVNINRFGKPYQNEQLMTVCKNSLEGKYTKWIV